MGWRTGLWMLGVLWLAGCASLPPLPPPAMETSVPVALQGQEQAPGGAYRIGPEDVLRLVVYEHPDLSQEVLVAEDGSVTLPLVGKVEAAGLTVRQLERRLTERLSDGYLVDPRLTVAVTRYRNRHVFILGAVRTPGVYPLRYHATLLELISQAGGPTEAASWYALLVRGPASPNGASPAAQEGRATARRIDLERLFAGDIAESIRVDNGDTIYVPPMAFFYVSGEVRQPGRYRLERGTTVLKAITLAGGFTEFAYRSRLRVRRVVDGQVREFQARLDDPLQADDILIVP